MIEIKHLTKTFGGTVAVDDVSLTIKDGEIFSLIGPNSSGKSTIVKNIVGLLLPSSGTIEVNGVNSVQNPLLCKKQIGYIPDEPSVWSHMTGDEFIYFTQSLFGVPPSQRKGNSLVPLKLFEIEDVKNQGFEQYSRGNRQKFSISAAFAHQPKVLLIDEPIVGLDPNGAETAKKLFTDFAKNGGSVLLVTHTLTVAEEISDRIGFLKHGRLIACGTLDELKKKADLPSSVSLDEVYKKLA